MQINQVKFAQASAVILSIFVFLTSGLLLASVLGAGAQPSQQLPPAKIDNSNAPADVDIPAGFSGLPIAFFDDYSWRTFIAMIWPVKDGARGVADTSAALALTTDKRSRVFETYKTLFEVFHKDGSTPAAWDQYDNSNACGQTLNFGDMELSSFSKFSHLGEAGVGNLVGPLVAQNGTYVRYLTSYNKIEFDKILGEKLYRRENLNTQPFKDGAIDLKSAWINMDGVSHPERFYVRKAWLQDPQSGACVLKDVGLVGLHIVQKTPSRPQWIWSSFEHVDNVPDGQTGKTTFNNGNGSGLPKNGNPILLNSLPPEPTTPYNVERLKPIHSSTQQTNTLYQNALKNTGSVFQFYRLVMTQWPVPPHNTPGTPAKSAFIFPGKDSDQTCFANTTMETFDQADVEQGSCMTCHNFARIKADFLFSLQDHSFAPAVPAATVDLATVQLKQALKAGLVKQSAFIKKINATKKQK